MTSYTVLDHMRLLDQIRYVRAVFIMVVMWCHCNATVPITSLCKFQKPLNFKTKKGIADYK